MSEERCLEAPTPPAARSGEGRLDLATGPVLVAQWPRASTAPRSTIFVRRPTARSLSRARSAARQAAEQPCAALASSSSPSPSPARGRALPPMVSRPEPESEAMDAELVVAPPGCMHLSSFKVDNWKQNLRAIYQCFVWGGTAEARRRKVSRPGCSRGAGELRARKRGMGLRGLSSCARRGPDHAPVSPLPFLVALSPATLLPRHPFLHPASPSPAALFPDLPPPRLGVWGGDGQGHGRESDFEADDGGSGRAFSLPGWPPSARRPVSYVPERAPPGTLRAWEDSGSGWVH